MGRQMTEVTLFSLKKRDSGHSGTGLMRKGEACHDTCSDSKLLQSNEPASDLRGGDFGIIVRNVDTDCTDSKT